MPGHHAGVAGWSVVLQTPKLWGLRCLGMAQGAEVGSDFRLTGEPRLRGARVGGRSDCDCGNYLLRSLPSCSVVSRLTLSSVRAFAHEVLGVSFHL